MSKKVSLERGTRITDDVTGIKAEILGPKDNGYYPVLLWDDKHVPTLGRLRSLPKSHEKEEQTKYAENMRSALNDTWKKVEKFVKILHFPLILILFYRFNMILNYLY